MPRRTLARRFEPRYGVNQVMLDVESKYVGRELEDHLIHSNNELRERLAKWRELTATAEQELATRFDALPDRDRLALRGMLARDFWHIAMLYRSFIASKVPDPSVPLPATAQPLDPPRTASSPGTDRPESAAPEVTPPLTLPFKEMLFE